MNRPYRIVTGICYNQLFNSPNQPDEISRNLSNPHDFYYDPAIRLNPNELDMFRGKPLRLEHKPDKDYGEIVKVWATRDGQAMMQARVWVDTPEGEKLFDDINNRRIKGLSVNYDTLHSNGKVYGKVAQEISACQAEFFTGSRISVTASGKPNYLLNNKREMLFSVMASEGKIDTAPLDQSNKDASALAVLTDDTLRKLEEAQKKLAELEAYKNKADQELALARQKEAKEQEEFQKTQKPRLDEFLAIAREQHKAENGADSSLPAEFEKQMSEAFMIKEAQPAIAPIVASAKAWKKSQEEKMAQKARLDELEGKMKKLTEDHQVALAHVEASKRTHLAPEPMNSTPVVASNTSKVTMSNLFYSSPSGPSEQERKLYQENFNTPLDSAVSVVASRGNAAPLPTHPFVNRLQFSPRNSPTGNYIFRHSVEHAHEYANAPVALLPGGISERIYEDK